jgi:hypothetical protein
LKSVVEPITGGGARSAAEFSAAPLRWKAAAHIQGSGRQGK